MTTPLPSASTCQDIEAPASATATARSPRLKQRGADAGDAPQLGDG
jgi:hypothetical protein